MDDYAEPLDLTLPSVKLKNRQSASDLPLDLSKKRIDNPQIMGPFSNSIMKNVPNFSCDKRTRMHQPCGSSSISYLNPPKPRNAHSCVPVRKPYPDNYEDELGSADTPFNFSCRYSETKSMNNGQNIDRTNVNYKGKKIKNCNGTFTIYAETDLDQPTDYSLRYAENNPECDNDEKTAVTEYVGDCVKTYCTEGTPYETPLNFSTSTSMSDLRMGEKGTVDGIEIQREKMKLEKNIPENDIDDKISEEEDIEETDDQPETEKIKSEFNSGLTSPEKPRNYCDEGTPGYFSRVSSFSSLNSAAAGSGGDKSDYKDKSGNQMKTPKSDKMQPKVVKFENNINYCEETPLMFSRTSSLESLDSIEQSIQDDRSSVISDFSRLTSGLISPSEIPDSPTQTVPPSPKQRKSTDLGMINRRQTSARRSLPTKSSIFEDDVTKFKEENTPAQFSVATSLSSLTIDDHDDTQLQNRSRQNCTNGSRDDEEDEDVNVDKVSLHDEADGQSFRNTRENVHNRCFPVPGSRQFQSNPPNSTNSAYNNGPSFSSGLLPPPLSAENNVRTYNTEDTPAVLSRNESISDLSMSTLSILDEEPASNRAYLSENSSQSSGDHRENIEQAKRSEASSNRMEMEGMWMRESTQKPMCNPYRNIDNLPPFLESKDECRKFAVEDSPAQLSMRSSLSHLTIESDIISGILDFSTKKETPESPQKVEENNVDDSSQQNFDETDNMPETQKEPEDLEEMEVITEKVSQILLNEDENMNESNENTKSLELKSDDSRTNSMKKRKWKWKWQFASEDGHSESGESSLTDKQSSANMEEFDQGRRNKMDKNNTGSLDASFRKKKWWKWKFGSKEKENTVGTQENVEETVQKDDITDKEHMQNSDISEEKESHPKEGALDGRSKSKRWKWKWKLGFKDDDPSKCEKSSMGLSKLKHQVSPEHTKVPVSISDVLQSSDVPKEMNTLLRFLPERQSRVELQADEKTKDNNENIQCNVQERMPVPVREKLATPEPSDSEQSIIIEEINEHYSSEDEGKRQRNSVNGSSISNKENLESRRTDKQPIHAVTVEECIKMEVAKNKIPTAKTVPVYYSPSLNSVKRLNGPQTSEIRGSGNNDSGTTPKELQDILEECIQLGMPKNKIPSVKTVSHNQLQNLTMSPKIVDRSLKTDEKSKQISSNGYIESRINRSNPNYQALRNGNRPTNFDSNDERSKQSSSNEYMGNNINRSNPSYQALRNASRPTNFDSSSLNRFPLDKTRRNVFNSNDNILTNNSNQESVNVINQHMRRPVYKECDNTSAKGFNKMDNNNFKQSSESRQFFKGRVFQKETFNSQSERSTPRISTSSSNSVKSESYSSKQKNWTTGSTVSGVSTKCVPPISSGKNPDYAILLEECIQLGMPKRKESSKESPTAVMHQKMNGNNNNPNKWPEYMSRISNENRSSSLPKASADHNTQDYYSSNDDFFASDLQMKRDMLLQRNVEKKQSVPTKVHSKTEVSRKEQDKMGCPNVKPQSIESTIVKYNHSRQQQNKVENEESLYANADETRSYLNIALNEPHPYDYEGLSEKFIRPTAPLNGGEKIADNTANLVEDCIKLGIPIKKIQEIRRSVERNNSQEIVTKYEGNNSETVDSDDEAVYANTTDRYASFRNSMKSTDGIKNREEKPSPSPKPYKVYEAVSPILPEKKIIPSLASNKNLKNNFRTEMPKIIPSTKSEVSNSNNQDFAAIIEECIQLGMPKRKEFSRETLNSNLSLASTNSRSNSVTRCAEFSSKVALDPLRSSTLPKSSTFFSNPQNYYSSNEDFSRANSQRKKNMISQYAQNTCGSFAQNAPLMNISQKDPDRALKSSVQVRSAPQRNSIPCNNQQVPVSKTNNFDANGSISERSQIEDNPEGSLYVNVSKHVGYSKSTNKQRPLEKTNLQTQATIPYTLNSSKADSSVPNYSALLEECIKLGMPSKKTDELQKYLMNLTAGTRDSDENSIKFGSPCSLNSEDVELYVNTSDRYPSIKDSMPEPVLDRNTRRSLPANSRKSIGENVKLKLDNIAPSSTIEKALEECIQLGWPKKKENGKGPAVKNLYVPSSNSVVKKTETTESKNVNVASVVRNMQNQHLACSKVPALTAGAKVDSEHQNAPKKDVEETLTSEEKNGFEKINLEFSLMCINKSSICSDDNQAGSEMSFASLADIDVKLLDPQIMLQNLEKYTEKLITEAEVIINSKNIKV